VQPDFLVCPNCRTRLHRVCPSCNRLAQPEWPLCAYCGHEFQRAPTPRPAERAAEWAAPAPQRTAETATEPSGLRRPANS
jgi:hypothetical protein